MFILDPGSWFLPIPDLGSKNSNKRQGWKKFCCQTIICSHKFHKTQYYFIFDMLKKKIWPYFPRIIEVFTQKIVTKPSKIWVWDLGSGIRDPGSGKNLFRVPDPGVKKAPDPGSRIRIRNTASSNYHELVKKYGIFLLTRKKIQKYENDHFSGCFLILFFSKLEGNFNT